MRACVACAVALSAVLAAAPVRAQTSGAAGAKGLALNTFDPAPPGDAFFGVPSPSARGELTPRALVYFDHAGDPLRLVRDGETISVMGRQATLHVAASLAVQDRLLVSASMPFALVQAGSDPEVSGYSAARKPQAGDLRLGARVRMLGEDDAPFQLGVGLDVHVPTAPAGSFAGDGSARLSPYVAGGGSFQAAKVDWVWAAALGAVVRTSAAPTALTWRAAFGARIFEERLQAGVEVLGATPLQEGTFTLGEGLRVSAEMSTNAELLFGAKVRVFRDLVVGWAGGPGLTHAIGTPSVRFVGTAGWVPGASRPAPPRDADTDGDGIPDLIDACPYAHGPRSAVAKKNGCPVFDDDEDGVPNEDDACPAEYGKPSADPKKNGCPTKGR